MRALPKIVFMRMLMVICRFSVWLGIFFWWSLSAGSSNMVAAELTEAQVKNEMELLAQKLPCFLVNEFLWDRMDDRFVEHTSWMSPAAWRACQEVLANINDKERYTTHALIPLLEHTNPKVRTLTLAALFAKEDGHLLPYIYQLVRDQAPTFDAYAPRSPLSYGLGNLHNYRLAFSLDNQFIAVGSGDTIKILRR